MKKWLIAFALLFSMAAHSNTTFTGVFTVAYAGSASAVEGGAYLANLSTRGYVGSGAENMHAGFVVAGSGKIQVLIKGAGPSMEGAVPGFQVNPAITLHNAANGAVIHSNDNWQDDPSSGLVQQTGKAPTDPKEAAFVLELGAGAYSVVQRGSGGSTGIGLPSVTQVTVSGTVPPPNGTPLPPEQGPAPTPTPTPTPQPQPQPQPNKPQNQILTERLIGNWVFNYKIIDNFSQAYSLVGPARESTTTPGDYLVFGTDSQGGAIGGGYAAKIKEYIVVDETPLFVRSYVFNFDSDNRVSGCYFQVDLNVTSLGPCFPMNGNRTSRARAGGYLSPEVLMEMVEFERANHVDGELFAPRSDGVDEGLLDVLIEIKESLE